MRRKRKKSNTESNLIVSGKDKIRKEVDAYTELIRENLEMNILSYRYPYDKELLEGIFNLTFETVLC